jgi:hypothetical protein
LMISGRNSRNCSRLFMVKTILRDIRAVGGVTGVALLRKRDGYTERIFPAAFTKEHSAALYDVLAGVYRQLRGFSRLMLSFERVTVHLYNRPELLLLVTTLPDHDQRVFELVVNSKFAALERALDNIPITNHVATQETHSSSESSDSVGLILDVVNRFSDKLIAECGRARVSQHWRDARKTVGANFPVLSLFTVDGNGHWAIRKGQQPGQEIRIGQSWAELLLAFLDKLGPLQPLGREFFASIADRYRQKLDQTGFLHFLKFPQSKGTPAGM